MLVIFSLLFWFLFWTLVDAASTPFFWTVVDAVSSATLALLALAAAIYYGHNQVKLARQESERRPVLEVAAMGLEHPSTVKQIREALEKGYSGPVPDLVLAVTLDNKGKDPALDVSGRLYIKHPLYPIAFPGVTSDIEIHEVSSWLRIVAVNTPTGFKLRNEANFDRLSFSISLQVKTKEPMTNVPIKYIFTPANGESVEGTKYFDIGPPRKSLYEM